MHTYTLQIEASRIGTHPNDQDGNKGELTLRAPSLAIALDRAPSAIDAAWHIDRVLSVSRGRCVHRIPRAYQRVT